MPEYQLYCFAQSGNSYRAALMLNLIGADWQPIFVDFLKLAYSARRSTEKRSMKWARRRCSFTGEVEPIRRDTHLSRRALGKIPAARRGPTAGSAALDHF